MTVGIAVATFETPTSTGSFDVTADLGGATPKAVWIVLSLHQSANDPGTGGLAASVGAATQSAEWCVTTSSEDDEFSTKCRRAGYDDRLLAVIAKGSPFTLLISAAVTSFITDGVTLTFTAVNASAHRGLAVFFYGDEVEAAAGIHDLTSETEVTNHGMANAPDLILFSTPHRDMNGASDNSFCGLTIGAAANAVGLPQACVSYSEQAILGAAGPNPSVTSDHALAQPNTDGTYGWKAAITAIDDTSFETTATIDTTPRAAAHPDRSGLLCAKAARHSGNRAPLTRRSCSLRLRRCTSDEAGYLALHLGGGSCHVWIFQTPTSTGVVADASPGFQPVAGFVLPTLNAALDAVVDDDDAGFGFGAFTADDEAAAAWWAKDESDPTNTASDLRAKALIVGDANGPVIEATLHRFTATGWELDYAAVDTSPRYAVGIAIEGAGPARRPPVIAAVAM